MSFAALDDSAVLDHDHSDDQSSRTLNATLAREKSAKKKVLLYIAGPFFNPEQVSVIARIEKECTNAGVPFFSPRLQHTDKPGVVQPVPKIDSTGMAKRVFDENYRNIEDCTHMLAVLDYLLPEGQSVQLVQQRGMADFPMKAISLPDTGTIWEMGVAYALRRPTVGLKVGAHGYMNLMITQSMVGVVNEGPELRAFLEGLLTDELRVSEWTGSHR